MKSIYSSKNIFDQVYEQEDYSQLYDLVSSHRKERKRFLNCVARYIHNKEQGDFRTLEIGCGTGIDLLILGEMKGCLLFGLDLSYEALRVTGHANEIFSSQLMRVNADGFLLPFIDETFDLIFSQGVLEHVSDDASFLGEQLRVLKAGGILVINVPQKFTVYTIVKHHRILTGTWPWGFEGEYSYFRLKRIGRLFKLNEKEVMGCRYWLHPLEPMWVLRSLWEKIQRFRLVRAFSFSNAFGRAYNLFWEGLERRFGHLFMREIVIVFEKPKKRWSFENPGG